MGAGSNGVGDGDEEDTSTDTEDATESEEDANKPAWKRTWKSMFAFLIFMVGLTIVFFCIGRWQEQWDVLETCYVIVQIFTTIGYGDITVTSTAAKLFVSFYVLMCLLVLAYLFNTLCQSLMDKSGDYLRGKLRRLQGGMDQRSHTMIKLQYGERNEAISATVLFAFFILLGMVFYRYVEHCSCSYGKTYIEGCDESTFEICAGSGGYVKEWADTFYMAVITLTTVGFGDTGPRSRAGRLFGIFWMWMGVGACVKWLEAMVNFFFERGASSRFRLRKAVDLATFHKLDKENKGYLTRADYRGYILVQFGLVDQDVLDCIDEHFNALDREGGEKNQVTLETIRRHMIEK